MQVRFRKLDRRDLIHLIPTALWAVALLPACAAVNRELDLGAGHVGWFILLGAYCFPLAVLMGSIDRVPEVMSAFRDHRGRFLFCVGGGLLLLILDQFLFGAILAVYAIVLMEFLHRYPRDRPAACLGMILPAGYFLLGFTLVMLWNDVIASKRYFATTDPLLVIVDRYLMAGFTVPRISAWFSRFPGIISIAEFIYFFMFNVMGAVLILLVLDGGARRAFRAVGAILFAYTVSLVLFMLMPSHGPYVGDAHHFEIFPRTLASWGIQQHMLREAELLWSHPGPLMIKGNYFIGFPCMHVVQPLIAIHVMRHRPRLHRALCVYTLTLVVAIFALDWHYLADVIGGIPVAWLSLRLLGENSLVSEPHRA